MLVLFLGSSIAWELGYMLWYILSTLKPSPSMSQYSWGGSCKTIVKKNIWSWWSDLLQSDLLPLIWGYSIMSWSWDRRYANRRDLTSNHFGIRQNPAHAIPDNLIKWGISLQKSWVITDPVTQMKIKRAMIEMIWEISLTHRLKSYSTQCNDRGLRQPKDIWKN